MKATTIFSPDTNNVAYITLKEKYNAKVVVYITLKEEYI